MPQHLQADGKFLWRKTDYVENANQAFSFQMNRDNHALALKGIEEQLGALTAAQLEMDIRLAEIEILLLGTLTPQQRADLQGERSQLQADRAVIAGVLVKLLTIRAQVSALAPLVLSTDYDASMQANLHVQGWVRRADRLFARTLDLRKQYSPENRRSSSLKL